MNPTASAALTFSNADTAPAILDWTVEDQRAVDTARVLAADAVEKVGNGHPGTAMSLAPAAYLLFQKLMRHDPRDPEWIGRDRFILSPGHSSLTLYIQLFLSGYGLELKDLEALRTWGLDPRPPRIQAHRGCGNHHRSAGPGARIFGGVRLLAAPPHAVCSTPMLPPANRRSTTPSG